MASRSARRRRGTCMTWWALHIIIPKSSPYKIYSLITYNPLWFVLVVVPKAFWMEWSTPWNILSSGAVSLCISNKNWTQNGVPNLTTFWVLISIRVLARRLDPAHLWINLWSPIYLAKSQPIGPRLMVTCQVLWWAVMCAWCAIARAWTNLHPSDPIRPWSPAADD